MKFFGLAVVAILMTGCAAPQAVIDEASKTLLPACLKAFSTTKYQEWVQHPFQGHPVFTISFSEDNKNMVCAMAWGGALVTTMEGRRAMGLNSCEKFRANAIQKNQKPFRPCQIFAEGNKILYRKSK